MSYTLGNQQGLALEEVKEWYKTWHRKKKQVFYMFGYAGTGKTFTARAIAEELGVRVGFAAYTGKASLVLRKAGCEGATTIHSLIYIPEVNPDTGIVTFRKSDESPIHDFDLLIVDEVSMVNEEIGKDLLSFEKPILVLGDPAQLPPVSGTGFFIVGEPDVMLTEIHRQAEGNPIIHLATMVRKGALPDPGNYGESRVLKKGTRLSKDDALGHEIIIAGRNITRSSMNQRIRRLKGYEAIDDEFPTKGEILTCLKNDKVKGLFNGGMYQVESTPYDHIGRYFKMVLRGLDYDTPNYYEVTTRTDFFDGTDIKTLDWRLLESVQHFDWGYAITAHRSQGSTYESCLIYDESFCFKEHWSKWLYTAVTRASERITIAQV